MLTPWKESYGHPRHILKSRDITLPTKVCLVKVMVFPVVMYGCESRLSTEELMLSNCGAREDSWESLGQQGDPTNPKGSQSWIFIGRTEAEVEASIFQPPDVKSWLIGKDPDAGKDWRQEEKGVKEIKMVRWHHWLNGHEFEQALGVMMNSETCCAAVHGITKSWTQLSDWNELNWTERKSYPKRFEKSCS